MASNYYDRQKAKVAIMGELVKRGWKVFGYKEDQSDSMTDYFSPAHWEGVAEKNGAVVCVDVCPATVRNCSGGQGRVKYVPDLARKCPACQGTGNEPDALSYREQVTCTPRGVSPIPYHDNGAKKCLNCSGRGHMLKEERYIEPWPKFQANPERKLWHVEQDGVILASGIGLSACAYDNYDPEKKAVALAALAKLVDKMETAASLKAGPSPKANKPAAESKPASAPSATAAPSQTATEPAAVFSCNKWCSWLMFASKPARAVADALKAEGWRWSEKRQGYYTQDRKSPPPCVSYQQTA